MAEFDSSPIEVLTALEAVRKRPQLYTGDVSDQAVSAKLSFQSLCHALDEAIDGNCSKINICAKPNGLNVHYDSGLPLKRRNEEDEIPAVVLLSALAACRNMKKHLSVGDEFCEIGVVPLNGVCSKFDVFTVNDSLQGSISFRHGKLVSADVAPNHEQEDMTKMEFCFDYAILPNFDLCLMEIAALASSASTKLGIQINVESGS